MVSASGGDVVAAVNIWWFGGVGAAVCIGGAHSQVKDVHSVLAPMMSMYFV
ncbi:MAG: hypothetical protein R2774_12745 [Saprospiraceae bacterium]